MNKVEIRRIVIEALAFSKVLTNIDEIVDAVVKEEIDQGNEKDTNDMIPEELPVSDYTAEINRQKDHLKAIEAERLLKENAEEKFNKVWDSIIANGGFINENVDNSKLVKEAGSVVLLKNNEVSLWLGDNQFLHRTYFDMNGIVHLEYNDMVGQKTPGSVIPSISDIFDYNGAAMISCQIKKHKEFSTTFVFG